MSRISQAEAQQTIGTELATLILEAVRLGYQDYYTKISDEVRAVLSATARAVFINDFMIQHAREIKEHPRVGSRVGLVTRRGRTHLLIGDLEIKMKKLSRNLLPSNIPTDEVRDYNTQTPLPIPDPIAPQQLEFPNMRKTIANLIAGYQENRRKSEVGIYVICPQGSHRREWEWKLSTVAQPTFVTEQLPTTTTPQPKRVVAKEPKVIHIQTDQQETYAQSPRTVQS